ncbi:ankyrin repeat domain-containing protein [Dyadobacter crusticola]|uniref:ankyrin repeat domain-containing protein n=1 Tax=Dyadobacter crusticola TaxID=292407 RepID=UPI0004E25013|nr:ankyrin repeat domain-containing protein [Dyadobacter crusticola]
MENYTQVIIHAARLGNVPVLQELVDLKTDVNCRDEKGYTPLIVACYNNQLEAARFLIESGADVNGADYGGNTALMGAAFKGYVDIANLLIDKGAHLDQQHGNGGTALMFATMFGRNDLVKLLISRGASTSILDARGLSVYDLAAQQNNQEALNILEKV